MDKAGKTVALAVLLAFVGCGCVGQPNYTEAALEYMEQKYGQEFVYSGPWGTSYASPATKMLLVTPDSGDVEVQILVEATETEDGFQFRDNYLALLYEDEMRQTLEQAAEEVFGTATVFYEAATVALSADLPADVSFAQYSQAEGSGIIATVAVPAGQDGPGRAEDLEKKLQKSGIHGLIRLVVLNQEQYDAATAESVRTIIGKDSYVRYQVMNPTAKAGGLR